jgi:hypothetical protein
MEKWIEVEAKGLKWLVAPDGQVKTPAHETTYTRTRNGKVQTFAGSFKEKVLSPCKAKNCYLEVAAQKDGTRVKMTVHRLVGMAYVPGYEPSLTINHINGNKLDNRSENLEWVSLAKNTQHQWDTGLVDLRGEEHPGSKLTTKQVLYIRRLLAKGIPAHTLAVIAGVSDSLIALIRDGKRWAHIK